MSLLEKSWEVYDFGDNIPLISDDSSNDIYGETSSDKNKCILLHISVAMICQGPPLGKKGGAMSSQCLKLPDWHAATGSNKWNKRWRAVSPFRKLPPMTH